MSGVAAAAKAALVGESSVLAPLMPAGVTVHYSLPRDISRSLVYGGSMGGPVELKAMAAGGRVKRSEDIACNLHVRVYLPNGTTEAAEARAAAICDVITNYIAANWTLGIDDLKEARVVAVDMGEPWTDDDGAGSAPTITVSFMTYLT